MQFLYVDPQGTIPSRPEMTVRQSNGSWKHISGLGMLQSQGWEYFTQNTVLDNSKRRVFAKKVSFFAINHLGKEEEVSGKEMMHTFYDGPKKDCVKMDMGREIAIKPFGWFYSYTNISSEIKLGGKDKFIEYTVFDQLGRHVYVKQEGDDQKPNEEKKRQEPHVDAARPEPSLVAVKFEILRLKKLAVQLQQQINEKEVELPKFTSVVNTSQIEKIDAQITDLKIQISDLGKILENIHPENYEKPEDREKARKNKSELEGEKLELESNLLRLMREKKGLSVQSQEVERKYEGPQQPSRSSSNIAMIESSSADEVKLAWKNAQIQLLQMQKRLNDKNEELSRAKVEAGKIKKPEPSVIKDVGVIYAAQLQDLRAQEDKLDKEIATIGTEIELLERRIVTIDPSKNSYESKGDRKMAEAECRKLNQEKTAKETIFRNLKTQKNDIAQLRKELLAKMQKE